MPKPSRFRPKRSRPATHSGKAPRQPRSYTPLSDALSQPLTFADTELAEGIQRHSLASLLRSAIHRQRRSDGEPLTNVLCALLVWPLLKVKSIHCFCAELCQILLLLSRIRQHLKERRPGVAARVFVDEGFQKNGRAIQFPTFAPEFANGMVCFANSKSIYPLQLADFAAFGMNRTQMIIGKEKLSERDLRFLRVYSRIAQNYQNIDKETIDPDGERPITRTE